MNFDIVFGLFYGSEAKGNVISKLAQMENYDLTIRTGAPNAGHTFYVPVRTSRVPDNFESGKYSHRGNQWYRKVVHQLLPSAAPWVKEIFFAPNSIINLEVLEREIREMADVLEITPEEMASRITIDPNAAIMDGSEEHAEKDIELQKKIGSTQEGVGAAQIKKISRLDPNYVWGNFKANKLAEINPYHLLFFCNTARSYDWYAEFPENALALVEGTQGTLLSINHCPYPFGTSRDSSASGIIADAGIPNYAVRHVIGVARTYPIRVAGNSGPLPNETTWAEIGLPEEITTVTKKVRRVARFDRQTFIDSLRINRPSHVAVTFMDYPNSEAILDDIEDISVEGIPFRILMTTNGPTPVDTEWYGF